MLRKLFLFIFMIFNLKNAVDSAVYIIPAQEKPPEYDCYEGCFNQELDKVLAYDKPYSPQDGESCLQYTCSKEDNSTYVYSCGAFDVPDSCERVPGNKYLAYPDCCDTVQCFAVDPVVDPAEPEPVVDPIETDPIDEPEEQNPGNTTASEPVYPAPESDIDDPVLVDPVPAPNSNNPPAENTSPIEPVDPTPLPEPQPDSQPPAEKPLPIRPRPIRPPKCPVYVADGPNRIPPNKLPTYCRPIINPKGPIYSTQPVPATTV